MPKLYWRKKAILLKKETTYGTDAVPAAANAVRAFDVSFTPLDAQVIEEESVQPYMGAGDTFIDQQLCKLEFSIHASGSGTAGTAPAYSTAFLVAGLAETVAAGTKTDYSPVSGGFDAGSLYFSLDGDLHKALGGRANVTFNIQRGKAPFFRLSYIGLYAPVASAALPTVDFSAYQRPVMPSKANTPTATLHGYSAIVNSLMVDLGQDVKGIFNVNDESVDIVNRAAKAKIVIQRPPQATKDFWAAMNAQPPVLDALNLVHGTAAGNIVEVTAPLAQITRIGHQTIDEIAYLDMDLSLKPSAAGNDEVLFTIK